MPHASDSGIRQVAIVWHIRLRDAQPEDWDEFADWLAENPRHNDVYDAISDQDLAMGSIADDLRPRPLAANDPKGSENVSKPSWSMPIGWSVAAAAILAVGVGWQAMQVSAAEYEIATTPGETRELAMADGSRVALNGDTRLRLNRDNPRLVEIEKGEARFVVKHDTDRPFELQTGLGRVVDIGTVFNVVRDPKAVVVEVSEGAVRFDTAGKQVNLPAGNTLEVRRNGELVAGTKSVDMIGTWQRGELVYRSTLFPQVAEDLGRAAGLKVNVSPALASKRFSGVIQTRGDRSTLRRHVEVLLGVKIIDSGGNWTLAP